jgi:glucan phosphoethanolaminetransferase (alkaline phosphatase superfamily)
MVSGVTAMTRAWRDGLQGLLRESRPWAWRHRWLLVMNLFLVSPLFFYELRIGEGGPDRTLLFLLPASMAWLLLVQLLIRRPLFAHLAMFPLYVTTAVDLYLIFNYHMRLGSSTILVIVDNLYDSVDYLEAHGSKVALAVGLFFAFYATCIFKIRHLQEPRRWRLAGAAFAALLALYGLLAHRSGGYFTFMLYQDRGAPFGVFPQGFVARWLQLDLARRSQNAARFSFKATRPAPVAEPETYVLVIGESARPDHFGVYGYPKPTTPLLDKQKNLLAFRDVVSQASITKDAVPFILTRGHALDPDRTTDERSIVSVYRELGFETYWFSTQQRDLTTGLINRFASEASTLRFYERRYDTFLLGDVERARVATPNGNNKRFIVCHMTGSHFYYPTRYPDEFRFFPIGNMATDADIINAYDNTIRHSDFFLSKLIQALEATPGVKAMLYVSDHGENLNDHGQNSFGHMLNTEYDLPVPLLFWYSDELAQQFPDKIANAKDNLNRRLSTRSVFYTLQDLVGARVVGDDPEAARLSVLSRQTAEVPRIIAAQQKTFDFDAKFPGHKPVNAAH